MNSLFTRIFMPTLLICITIATVQAAEVHFEDDRLVVAGVDDSLGLGAFDFILTYGDDVTINSVDGLSGFMVAANIKNEEGVAIVAGISTEGLTEKIPVATVKRSGTGAIGITTRMLANTKGDPITIANPETAGSVPTQQPPSGDSTARTPPITTSSPIETIPIQSVEDDWEQNQSEATVATQTVTTLGTPMATKATDVVETAKSVQSEGLKTTLTPIIAIASLLIVLVLKRKIY